MSIESLRERLRKAGRQLLAARQKEQAAKDEQYRLIERIRVLQTQLDDAEYSVERNWNR